jgi:hypothetical protein
LEPNLIFPGFARALIWSPNCLTFSLKTSDLPTHKISTDHKIHQHSINTPSSRHNTSTLTRYHASCSVVCWTLRSERGILGSFNVLPTHFFCKLRWISVELWWFSLFLWVILGDLRLTTPQPPRLTTVSRQLTATGYRWLRMCQHIRIQTESRAGMNVITICCFARLVLWAHDVKRHSVSWDLFPDCDLPSECNESSERG